MGITRLGFFARSLGWFFWQIVSIAVAGDVLPLGLLMWLGGIIWYLFSVVPSRLANAGISRVWCLALLVPFVNIIVLLLLFFAPPHSQPETATASDTNSVPDTFQGPRRDRFIEVLSKIALPESGLEKERT